MFLEYILQTRTHMYVRLHVWSKSGQSFMNSSSSNSDVHVRPVSLSIYIYTYVWDQLTFHLFTHQFRTLSHIGDVDQLMHSVPLVTYVCKWGVFDLCARPSPLWISSRAPVKRCGTWIFIHDDRLCWRCLMDGWDMCSLCAQRHAG